MKCIIKITIIFFLLQKSPSNSQEGALQHHQSIANEHSQDTAMYNQGSNYAAKTASQIFQRVNSV